MARLDQRDLVGGATLIVFGAAFAGYAVANYPLGTFTYMAAGMLPAAIGCILALIGLCITTMAFFRSGTIEFPALRPYLSVMLALAGFALTIEWLGLVAAVFIVTLVSATAEKPVKIVPALVLAIVLAVLTVSIFVLGLGMRFKIFPWSW
jgi:hypothetical protein